jgi:VIT1/CCC1 family predicted Fe2+/Mn2+ transporter
VNAFIRRHLDPASRLGEILFGLIMALGITGSVRLGNEEADRHELFVAILGCNVAWAIVDAVMYVLTELFERGRKERLAASVRAAPTEQAALDRIGEELDLPLLDVTTAEERQRIHENVLKLLRRRQPVPARIQRGDLLSGLAVALVIVIATLPVVVPFLVVPDTDLAIRVSNGVALAQLFLLGAMWGRAVGTSPWKLAAGLALVGLALVLVTILLGG